jgi:hypothetical protein
MAPTHRLEEFPAAAAAAAFHTTPLPQFTHKNVHRQFMHVARCWLWLGMQPGTADPLQPSCSIMHDQGARISVTSTAKGPAVQLSQQSGDIPLGGVCCCDP